MEKVDALTASSINGSDVLGVNGKVDALTASSINGSDVLGVNEKVDALTASSIKRFRRIGCEWKG